MKYKTVMIMKKNMRSFMNVKKKLKINSIIIEKYNVMLENPNFEQNFWPRTAIGIYKTGNVNIRLMKWLAYHDRSCFENINYYDLMASFLICLENDN